MGLQTERFPKMKKFLSVILLLNVCAISASAQQQPQNVAPLFNKIEVLQSLNRAGYCIAFLTIDKADTFHKVTAFALANELILYGIDGISEGCLAVKNEISAGQSVSTKRFIFPVVAYVLGSLGYYNLLTK